MGIENKIGAQEYARMSTILDHLRNKLPNPRDLANTRGLVKFIRSDKKTDEKRFALVLRVISSQLYGDLPMKPMVF